MYSSRAGEGKVEIVWQELKDFESLTVGSMILEVTETGFTAQRGAGDPAKGYGKISLTPLNGEDVLVRRLADAASQAVEKGLANKAAKAEKKAKPQPKAVPAAPAVSTLVTDSGTVEQPAAAAAPPAASSEAGPRAAGARRSSERTRGRRRKAAPPKKVDDAAAAKPEDSSEAFQ